MNKIQSIHQENLKKDVPEFNVGDNLRIQVLIVEDKRRD